MGLVFFRVGEATGFGEGVGHFCGRTIGGGVADFFPVGDCDRHFF